MNTLKYFLSIAILLAVATGCKKDKYDDTSFASSAAAPDKVSVMFDITQDNSGKVTIAPNGEGGVSYDIYFGDGTVDPAVVIAGGSTQHTYAEGVYDVRIVSHGVNGKTTESTQQLTVAFRAPENLAVTAAVDAANNYKVNVSASALYETVFKVYFGDVPNEVPTSFLEGQTISHVYTATGTYSVRVVAFGGGTATAETTTTITIVDPVLLPINFESPTINYAFNNFDGGNVTVVSNPQANGINTSAKVAKMVKNAGQPWGGSWIGLGSSMDFSTNKYFRMKVYSPRVGAKVLLKVENAANAALNFEKEVTTTVANTWEDLFFDYSAINTANTYEHIVIIFDNGTQGDGSANFTFLMDDIRLTNTLPAGSGQVALPITFDDPAINYTTIDFGNNQTIDAADPANSANKVKKTTKLSGAETWAGTTMSTSAGLASAIPFTATATQMTIRVYSPAAGIHVRLKVEDHAINTHSVETEAITTVANGWETLNFDFSNQATGTAALNLTYVYDLASVFFDFGNAGTGRVFYWDDVKFLSTNVTTGIALPLDFQSTSLTYAFTDFNGGNAVVIDNPQVNGINTSSKVGRMIKNAGEVWGGSWIGLASPINFSGSRIFKMKVYSPRVGAKVLLKVENQNDGAISFEKEVTTTVANAWEELTFDFTAINTANSYQKVVLIFDLGTMGDGSANYTFSVR